MSQFQQESAELPLGSTEAEILENISEGVLKLNKNFVQGPFTLVVSEKAYKLINSKTSGYQSSDDKEVKFFVTESFAFSVLNKDVIIRFN